MSIAAFSGPYMAAPMSSISFGLGGGGAKDLGLNMPSQGRQVNWCWAAATAAVANLFDKSVNWTPCAVASKCFDNVNCCNSPHECDDLYLLEEALATLKIDSVKLGRIAKFEEIVEMIDMGAPVGCWISHARMAGHFVVIDGYDKDNQDVNINDSLYPGQGLGSSHTSQVMRYASFARGYQSGYWEDTYKITRRRYAGY